MQRRDQQMHDSLINKSRYLGLRSDERRGCILCVSKRNGTRSLGQSQIAGSDGILMHE